MEQIERNEAIYRAVSEGKKYAEVAREYGLSRERIRSIYVHECHKRREKPRTRATKKDELKRRILAEISYYTASEGRPPSQTVIADLVGIPGSRLNVLIKELVYEGKLSYEKYKRYNLTVLVKGDE